VAPLHYAFVVDSQVPRSLETLRTCSSPAIG
jgi:hypothetical protein